jgi:hypothetical protein
MKKNRLTHKKIKERSFDLEHIKEFQMISIDKEIGVIFHDKEGFYVFIIAELKEDIQEAVKAFIQEYATKLKLYMDVDRIAKKAMVTDNVYDCDELDTAAFMQQLDAEGYMIVKKRSHKIQEFLESDEN